MRIHGKIAIAMVGVMLCSRLSADFAPTSGAMKLAGPVIEMFNTKVQTTQEGLENLKSMLTLEKTLSKVLDRAAKRKAKFSKKEVKVETKNIVDPLRDYIVRLWPGKEVTKEMLRLSLEAHGRDVKQSILWDFLNQPDLTSMLAFFEKTVDDHDKFVQACRDFIMVANDVKKSVSVPVKERYKKFSK